MSRFMLLLHDSTTAITTLSPDDIQRIIARYKAWSERIAAAGHLVGGEKLHDEGGKHLTRGADGKMVVRDGPYAEAKEIIGGFFMIEAADYAQAVALCADSPHFELGGWIEIREVEPTS